jgi:predicted Ser/Thr protein kinase
LRRRCGGDANLLRRVQDLLEEHWADTDSATKAFVANTDDSPASPLQDEPADALRSSDSSIHGRFLPGTVIDRRYRIVSLAGRGGMGEVYRADDLKLQQTVALKFLPSGLERDPNRLTSFHQEVRLARQISHPNVCRVYDIGEVNGQHFLSMEYIDGEDLRVLLRRIGRLPPDKGVEIAQQLCAGLAAAHEKGVLHRDLKPANVMIDGRGQVRITDFGLAKIQSEHGPNEVAGTPAYMAPEQLLRGETSKQSDLYALGLILAELFLGKPVHEARGIPELTSLHESTESRVPSFESVGLAPGVERAIAACLQKSPADRPLNARQLANALPGGDPLEAAVAAGVTPSPELVINATGKDQLPLPWAIGCLVLVLLGVVGSAIYAGQTQRMPLESPEVLGARCLEIAKQLGYDALPQNTVSRIQANVDLWTEIAEANPSQEWIESFPEPKYKAWRRWTDGTFDPLDYHAPYAHEFRGAISGGQKEVAASVDETGNLLYFTASGLEAGSEQVSEDSVDWAAVMDLAGLAMDDLSPVEPTIVPPVYCEQVKAWQTTSEDSERVIQAGTLGGRINYFEVVGLKPKQLDAMLHIPGVMSVLLVIIRLFVFLVAFLNIRAGRADRRSAIRAAIFVFALYVFLETLGIQLKAPDRLRAIQGLIFDESWGHSVGHGLFIFLTYLAIEPYVRRYWPKSLVAWVRLFDGRWTDASVGRELLVGIAAGLLGSLAWMAIHLVFPTSPLQLNQAFALSSDSRTWIASNAHTIASTMLNIFMFAALCVVIRVLFRRVNFLVAMLGVLLVLHLIFLWEVPAGGQWTSVIASFGFLSITTLVFTRVGFLAATMSIFTMDVLLNSLIPVRFDSWYFSYALSVYVILVAPAVFGFVTSQGGIMKLLSFLEPPAEGFSA